jgi:hypothetical protein
MRRGCALCSRLLRKQPLRLASGKPKLALKLYNICKKQIDPAGSDMRFALPKLRLQAVMLIRSHITAHTPSQVK